MNRHSAWRAPLAVGLGTAALLWGAAAAWAGPVTFGAKGGLAVASFRDDLALLDYKTKLGWSGGVFVAYPAKGLLAVQVEALYVMRGASMGDAQFTGAQGEDLGTVEILHAWDNLDFAVLAKLRPLRGTSLGPYLLLGPALMAEIRERIVVKGAIDNQMWRPQGGSVDELKSTALGLNLGVGADVPVGPGRCLLEARYDLGLSDIARPSYPGRQHAASWRVMTGYSF